MALEPDVADLAALLAEPARLLLLVPLTGGEAIPAGDLARRAGVTPQTASAHRAKLAAASLVTIRASGRHRYYALSGGEMADLLERLAFLAHRRPVRSLQQSSAAKALAQQRPCYDHLAGELGVALGDGLLAEAWLDEDVAQGWQLSSHGEREFIRLRIDLTALRTGSRPLIRQCLDWSERRPHLAGALGQAVLAWMFGRGFLEGMPATRAVRPTGRAAQTFKSEWGWDLFGVAIPSEGDT